MKKLKLWALALVCALFAPVKADEGMWLLQLMQEQNLADRMKAAPPADAGAEPCRPYEGTRFEDRRG